MDILRSDEMIPKASLDFFATQGIFSSIFFSIFIPLYLIADGKAAYPASVQQPSCFRSCLFFSLPLYGPLLLVA